MTGVAIAQVSDARDPQHQGRVKLTFPWLSDDYVSDWARTVHAGAGKDRGLFVLPEVGDEVLVAFEQGDIRRPVRASAGCSTASTPPKAGPIDDVDGGSGAINRRSLVSRRGHRIDLLDQDGRKEGIALATGDGKHTFTLDATGSAVTLHSDGSVTIEAKNGVTVDAGSSSLKLTGGDVSITATTGLTLDGGPSVKVNASGQVAVSGGDDPAELAGREGADACHRQPAWATRPATRASSGPPASRPCSSPGCRRRRSAPRTSARSRRPPVHPPSAIVPPGCPTVLIGGMPAARVGDMAACGAPIVVGAPTVLIGG